MRLQNAIEYLTTYAWAIIILTITVGILFALGLFNTSNYYAQGECSMTSGFACSGLSMATNGLLTYTLQQSTNNPINLTSYTCDENDSIAYMQPPSKQVYLSVGSNYTVSVQCYGQQGSGKFSGSVGTAYSGYIIVNYTDQVTKLPSTVFGRITVKVA